MTCHRISPGRRCRRAANPVCASACRWNCLRSRRCSDPVEGRRPVHNCVCDVRPLNTAIFIANGDGSNERMLAPEAMFDSNPSFSPDERWVLFSSRRHGSVDIYRVQVDGTRLERLTDDVAFDDQAVMSPDGRGVAFVSSRSGQADIWLLDLQSKRLRNLTNHRGGDYRPAWFPDGKWIAFTSDRDSDGALAHTTFPSSRPYNTHKSTSWEPMAPAFGA